MSKYLVVVESPTKAKTISKILDKQFDVASCMGHIVDLPSNTLAVRIKEGFLPYYKVIPGKEKILKLLREKARGAQIVYLATDPDREGEAIGWHIKERLSKTNDKFLRVIFHEITEDAIREAFRSPQEIDINKVDAQKTRRILDRIVGYFLSPLLWKKIVRGLSAGRVQSVALKFIVEKEREIKKFVPQTTYGIEAILKRDSRDFKGRLVRFRGKKVPFHEKTEAQKVCNMIKKERFFVEKIDRKEIKRKPPPPFTTSLLQQEAFNKLRFSSQKTMFIAQKLYEGVKIEDQMLGLITYMRTDSFLVAEKAKSEVKDYLRKEFGAHYLPEKDHRYKEKKRAQLAHEAIRPTSVFRTPSALQNYLSLDEAKLYELIWRRFIASFMKEAILKFTKVRIRAQDAEFVAEGKEVLFDGFLRIAGSEEAEALPHLNEGDELILERLKVSEHTTKPPPRFTDASLVKLLEEKGIGRPSTYAPTIYTLIKRNYIRREKGQFVPTTLGVRVNDLLVKYFPQIMDETFTAQIEEKLDKVEEGKIRWRRILEEFYPSFKEQIDRAHELIKKQIEFTTKICPRCSRPLVIKWSRRGRFLSCSGFPQCKYAESITTGLICPGCNEGKLIERRNKKGQRFYGCTRYPKCTYTTKKLPDNVVTDNY
jgi:DNA topoisomerase-1